MNDTPSTPLVTPLNSYFLQHFLPYQRRWLLDGRQFKIGLWARQTGKDFTCAAEAALDAAQRPNSHWLIVACSERQARESLSKARQWVAEINDLMNLEAYDIGDSGSEICLSNGSRITALPANPETIRGYSANVILTEFAFHYDQEAIWRAVFPSVSNPLRGGLKKLRIISTPGGFGNLFHKLWTGQEEGASLFGQSKITIHDAVAQGLPMNIPSLKSGIAVPEAWSQEYECEFVDQTTVLLPYALIEQCESTEATETGIDFSRTSSDLFAGIDFGRKHDLTVCWILERVAGELWTREVLTLERMSTPAQFELLRGRLPRARRICVDYTGAGVGLGDLLARQFGSSENGGRVELCTFSSALKAELFPKLRGALEARKLWLPVSQAIREDLHAVHRVVSAQGQIAYRASHSADGHSDRCTALALALRAAESAPPQAFAKSIGRKFAMAARY
ncbi:MAG TPA: terminase family protein [Verrucomicrobiae bacterium]